MNQPTSPEATFRSLATHLQPRVLTLELPMRRGVLNKAERELRQRAAIDPDGCFGYYPATEAAEAELPHSQAFAEAWPVIRYSFMRHGFDWIKYSSGKLPGSEGFHVDVSPANGLGGEGKVKDGKLQATPSIRRIVTNLHAADRYLDWLNVDPSSLEWQERDGFVTLATPLEELPAGAVQRLVIPRRAEVATKISAVAFYASHVPHGARELPQGHFLASWSCGG